MKNLIEIRRYDPDWPAAFRAAAEPLRAALGDLALRIDHIGSTAVPGLAAKDVIDIQATVQALDATTLRAAIVPLGYTFLDGYDRDDVPPGWDGPPEEWRKLLFSESPGRRRTNLHIRQAGGPTSAMPCSSAITSAPTRSPAMPTARSRWPWPACTPTTPRPTTM